MNRLVIKSGTLTWVSSKTFHLHNNSAELPGTFVCVNSGVWPVKTVSQTGTQLVKCFALYLL